MIEFWTLILSKKLRVYVVKIPRSHATDAMAQANVMTKRDRVGNDFADRLAKKGAALSDVLLDLVVETNLSRANLKSCTNKSCRAPRSLPRDNAKKHQRLEHATTTCKCVESRTRAEPIATAAQAPP